MSAILRHEVPVDDRWHVLSIPPGPVLAVNCQDPRVVEFWAFGTDYPEDYDQRSFRVFGTGHDLPTGAGTDEDDTLAYRGTAVYPATYRLVWHLFEAASGYRLAWM